MAENCCSTNGDTGDGLCPRCCTKGRAVQTITLKSLLVPSSLEKLDPNMAYFFCPKDDCEAVYFGDGTSFTTKHLKVTVFQKNTSEDVPVCYCFDWTRKRIAAEIQITGKSTAVEQITEHIRAGRCGCEVNNPQGSCCLGNVRSVIKEWLG